MNNKSSATSPSSSSSCPSSCSTPQPTASITQTVSTNALKSTQSRWDSISKARSSLLSLSSFLPPDTTLSSIIDSDNPALSFISSLHAYSLFIFALFASSSGSGSDPLCQWLYETYLSSDSHLRAIVLTFVPVLSGLYLNRIHSNGTSSLAGFEAVLLAIYSSEVKSRGGKPVVINVPDLSQPSLYHTPRNKQSGIEKCSPQDKVLWPPLEPQIAVKSTKRFMILGVVFDCYFKQISVIPSWSKLDLCKYIASWAGQDRWGEHIIDEDEVLENGCCDLDNGRLSNGVAEEGMLNVKSSKAEEDSGLARVRIPLPWEFLQPLLRITSHCLLGPLSSQDVKDAASVAVKRLYARASHDLSPQMILATRSLVKLDKRATEMAKKTAASASNSNVPIRARKSEVVHESAI